MCRNSFFLVGLVALMLRVGVLKADDQPLIGFTDQPVTIVCLGDSVTGVYYHTGGVRAYPEMLEVAIQQVYPKTPVTVINAGISGNTTADGLARLEADVLQHQPDLVTISFGLNDMARIPIEVYRQNLEALIARCRAANCQVVLCTPNTVISTSGRPIDKLKLYCDALRQVGQDQGVVVCDQFAIGEADKERDRWAWRLTLSDEIHPNMDGHKQMAQNLCRTIAGKTVSLADEPPPRDPLSITRKRLEAGQPVKVLAMPPFDELIRPTLQKRFPQAEVEIVSWPTAGKTIMELTTTAQQNVRKLRPNLVVLAVPRTANVDNDEQFVRSYSWVMNWSLSFGSKEWDCVVVHPAVVDSEETSTRDDMVRQLVRAQDLWLIDRPTGDSATRDAIFLRWFEPRLNIAE